MALGEAAAMDVMVFPHWRFPDALPWLAFPALLLQAQRSRGSLTLGRPWSSSCAARRGRSPWSTAPRRHRRQCAWRKVSVPFTASISPPRWRHSAQVRSSSCVWESCWSRASSRMGTPPCLWRSRYGRASISERGHLWLSPAVRAGRSCAPAPDPWHLHECCAGTL